MPLKLLDTPFLCRKTNVYLSNAFTLLHWNKKHNEFKTGKKVCTLKLERHWNSLCCIILYTEKNVSNMWWHRLNGPEIAVGDDHNTIEGVISSYKLWLLQCTTVRPTLVRRVQNERGVNIYALYSSNSAYSQEMHTWLEKKRLQLKTRANQLAFRSMGYRYSVGICNTCAWFTNYRPPNE